MVSNGDSPVLAAVDWGDVPTWFASGSSLLALLFAAAAVIAARRTFRIELDRDRVNAAARRAQDAYLRRAQAALVSAWWGESDTSNEMGAVVRNASDAPVYQAHVTVASRDDDSLAKKIDLPVIPPTGQPVCHPVPGLQPMSRSLADALRVTLTFTDASGVRWVRDEYGHLEECGNELRLWFHARIGAVLERFAIDFRRAYGVDIGFEDTEVFGELQDRFVQAARSLPMRSVAPDMLFAPHDWIGNLSSAKAIRPVVVSAADREYFGERALGTMAYQGRLYGLPVVFDTIVLYRNPELVPDAPATIEELLAVGTALRDAGQVRTPLAMQVGQSGDPFHLYPLFTSAGGWLFGENPRGGWDPANVGVAQPESVHAFERIQQLGEPGQGVLRVAVDAAEAYRLFLEGEAPFLITTSWGADYARRRGKPFAVSPVPPFEGGQPPQLLLSVTGFMVAAHSPNQALALDLVADFLTRPDVTEALAETMVSVPAVQDYTTRDPVLLAFQEECARARPMPAAAAMRRVWWLLGRAQVQILDGADVRQVTSVLAGDLRYLADEPQDW